MTYQQPDGQQPYGQPSYGQQPYGQPSYAQQPQQNTGTGTNTGAGAPGASHTGYPANYNYNTYIPPKAEPALGLRASSRSMQHSQGGLRVRNIGSLSFSTYWSLLHGG